MILDILMKSHYIISKCQISKSKNLKKIINLGFTPPVNQLLDIKKQNKDYEIINFFEDDILKNNLLYEIGYNHALFEKKKNNFYS